MNKEEIKQVLVNKKKYYVTGCEGDNILKTNCPKEALEKWFINSVNNRATAIKCGNLDDCFRIYQTFECSYDELKTKYSKKRRIHFSNLHECIVKYLNHEWELCFVGDILLYDTIPMLYFEGKQ